MKDKDEGSPERPFYQNILDQRKRRSTKPGAAAKKTASGADSGRESDVRRGSAPHSTRSGASREGSFDSAPRKPRTPRAPFKAPDTGNPVYAALSPETSALLEDFSTIIQSVMPLDSKKTQQLPADIRELSHELTDERSERHVGYMNEPPVLSAYVRYFMWWNLVRLTRLFSGLPLALSDGDAAVDLGSGPLTLPIALWMSRPDLRKKQITWYCVDLSHGALSVGEELFLSLAARTGDEPWQIVRITGELGVSLRRKVRLVAGANMFNELFWDNPQPIESQAKQHAQSLSSYAESEAAILVIEPGVPRAGRFVTLIRDSLARLGFAPVSPCPHTGVCPLPGLKNGKWCHFVFDTSDAPKALHKLSDDAGLAKDRAALSFIYAERKRARPEESDSPETDAEADAEVDALFADGQTPGETAPVASPLERVARLSGIFSDLPTRIASDPIRLPDYRTGRYACSEIGMVLVTGTGTAAEWLDNCPSGAFLELTRPSGKNPERDEKTGAILIDLGGDRVSRSDRPGSGNRPTRENAKPYSRDDRSAKPYSGNSGDNSGYAGRPARDNAKLHSRDDRSAKPYSGNAGEYSGYAGRPAGESGGYTGRPGTGNSPARSDRPGTGKRPERGNRADKPYTGDPTKRPDRS